MPICGEVSSLHRNGSSPGLLHRLALAGIALVLGSGYTLWSSHVTTERLQQMDAARYTVLADRVRVALARHLDAYVVALHAARPLVAGGRQPSRQSWRTFTASVLDRHSLPALRAVGWAPTLAPAEVAGFLAATRA